MSKIIDKPFDEERRIARSVFRGAPNLFTTADLNRQIEALQSQIDKLYARVGGIYAPDLSVTFTLRGSTLSVRVEDAHIEVSGCLFRLSDQDLTYFGVPSGVGDRIYFILYADKSLVTYDLDDTHEVAGVKFQDGTSSPAADQYVYGNEECYFELRLNTTSDMGDHKAMAVLGYFQWDIFGKLKFHQHWNEWDRGNPLTENCLRTMIYDNSVPSGLGQPYASKVQRTSPFDVVERMMVDLRNGERDTTKYPVASIGESAEIFGYAEVNQVSKVLFVTMDLDKSAQSIILQEGKLCIHDAMEKYRRPKVFSAVSTSVVGTGVWDVDLYLTYNQEDDENPAGKILVLRSNKTVAPWANMPDILRVSFWAIMG